MVFKKHLEKGAISMEFESLADVEDAITWLSQKQKGLHGTASQQWNRQGSIECLLKRATTTFLGREIQGTHVE